ncbi:MAG: hypothetical protein K0R93_2228 [Anaerosolibacter sp.]|jgi:hypothetical protein|uniref:hypothetical protein n=1 Tax=Anaerosolibacter sp. TaxID=1872527 RepID=UPI002626DB51|nr:hypothetical protein [Anaerosolibacter sp.]MDF2547330.1 hypothetical protein [Anaerosolibacter sp.]
MENVSRSNSTLRGKAVQKEGNIDVMPIVSIIVSILIMGMVMFFSNNLDSGSLQPQPDGVYINYLLNKDI